MSYSPAIHCAFSHITPRIRNVPLYRAWNGGSSGDSGDCGQDSCPVVGKATVGGKPLYRAHRNGPFDHRCPKPNCSVCERRKYSGKSREVNIRFQSSFVFTIISRADISISLKELH